MPLSLPTAEMTEFGEFITMDLAERHGTRGHRQKAPMVGMFTTWAMVAPESNQPAGGKPRLRSSHGFRRSDFSLRVALLVYGWNMTGMPILLAAEKVAAEYELFLRLHLGIGKRGRKSKSSDRTDIDESVRTQYYKLVEAGVCVEAWFELFLGSYRSWLEWVKLADERAIRWTVRDYVKGGHPERAAAFQRFADRVRKRSTPGLD